MNKQKLLLRKIKALHPLFREVFLSTTGAQFKSVKEELNKLSELANKLYPFVKSIYYEGQDDWPNSTQYKIVNGVSDKNKPTKKVI